MRHDNIKKQRPISLYGMKQTTSIPEQKINVNDYNRVTAEILHHLERNLPRLPLRFTKE